MIWEELTRQLQSLACDNLLRRRRNIRKCKRPEYQQTDRMHDICSGSSDHKEDFAYDKPNRRQKQIRRKVSEDGAERKIY